MRRSVAAGRGVRVRTVKLTRRLLAPANAPPGRSGRHPVCHMASTSASTARTTAGRSGCACSSCPLSSNSCGGWRAGVRVRPFLAAGRQCSATSEGRPSPHVARRLLRLVLVPHIHGAGVRAAKGLQGAGLLPAARREACRPGCGRPGCVRTRGKRLQSEALPVHGHAVRLWRHGVPPLLVQPPAPDGGERVARPVIRRLEPRHAARRYT